MAVGPWYVCILPGLLFTLYLTAYPALLFGLLGFLTRRMPHSSTATLILWVCGLCGMISIIDRYCLAPFGTIQGCPFFNPLLPLVMHPHLLRLVPYLGVELMIVLLLSVAATITYFLLHPSRGAAGGVMITVLPWLVMACMPVCHAPEPQWISRIAVLPMIYPVHADQHAAAQSLLQDLCITVHTHPHVDIIIVPESALPGALIRQLCTVTWPDACAHIQLIAGSNCVTDGCYCNCALWLTASGQKSCFAKRRLVPPIEYMPRVCSLLNPLYFSRTAMLHASGNERPCFKLDDTVQLVPYICSELFLSRVPDEEYAQIPLVLLVNDTWCKAEYLAHCMYMCARFKAIVWSRDIVYASFCHAAWLSKTGELVPLIRA
jgi:apolipoprotein N-acyltransferase